MEKLTHKINYSSRDKNIAKSPITDNYSRTFRYLRIAVNERCNFRCIYCMPEKGTSFNSQNKLLTCNEIFKLIEIMADLNVEKIRFTGGEPLLRKSIPKIIGFASRIPSISSINLTTNGFLLSNYIESLQKAGLTGINISLDTLNPKKFEKITRKNGLGMVLNGIESVIKSEIPNICPDSDPKILKILPKLSQTHEKPRKPEKVQNVGSIMPITILVLGNHIFVYYN